jgi:hypothetical protein
MGNEVACLARFEGKSSLGRAFLEATEIIFRGDFRLKIPFEAITEMAARDGVLRVRTKDGLALFHLGARAAKWRERIANPKPIMEKLGVKTRERVSLLGRFAADFLESLRKQGTPVTCGRISSASQWVFLAAEKDADLVRVKRISRAMRDAMALWIVYPKGQKIITENGVRAAGLGAGLTDIKVASFSPTHSALKFVIPKAKR